MKRREKKKSDNNTLKTKIFPFSKAKWIFQLQIKLKKKTKVLLGFILNIFHSKIKILWKSNGFTMNFSTKNTLKNVDLFYYLTMQRFPKHSPSYLISIDTKALQGWLLILCHLPLGCPPWDTLKEIFQEELFSIIVLMDQFPLVHLKGCEKEMFSQFTAMTKENSKIPRLQWASCLISLSCHGYCLKLSALFFASVWLHLR